MARIRSVKPELRDSAVVAAWPVEVRYFWVLLWGYLDDDGRGLDLPKRIAGDCFPHDDYDAKDVDGWLDRMGTPHGDEPGPVCRYTVAGKRYLHAVNWHEHQKPNRPTPSRLPKCPVHEGLTEPCSEGLTEHVSEIPGAGEEELGAGEVGSRSRGEGEGSPRATRGRATRLPSDFVITDPMREWAKVNVPNIDIGIETEKFANYYRAKSGKDAARLDWPATWRNWMLNARQWSERDSQQRARASPKSTHEPYRDNPEADYYGDL